MKTKLAQPPAPKLSRTHQPDGMELEEWQRLLRVQFGEKQDFRLENIGRHPVFSDFSLTNPASVRTYRIAIRGDRPGDNYCSCPDFRINALGTCKHIAFTLARLKNKRGAKKLFRDGFTPPYSEIYLSYGLRREVRFKTGTTAPDKLRALARRWFDEHGVPKEQRFADFTAFLTEATKEPGHELRCYDDVMEFVAHRQDAVHCLAMVDGELPDGIDTPLFDTLLKTRLYSYQREGVIFAVRAGRSLIADDMGLGKTIQVIEGLTAQRRALYQSDSFFKLSIEERILDLLRFKKALFAGALDEEGRDTVMIGESQMDAFMRSVEEVTERLESPDRAAGQEEWREEAEASLAGEEVVPDGEPTAVEADSGTALPPLVELLQNGARFLSELGKALSLSTAADGGVGTKGGEASRPNPLGSFVEIDKTTGKSCLKIPLPEPEVVATVVAGLGQLLAGLMAGRK